jgi:hypothetical protein
MVSMIPKKNFGHVLVDYCKLGLPMGAWRWSPMRLLCLLRETKYSLHLISKNTYEWQKCGTSSKGWETRKACLKCSILGIVKRNLRPTQPSNHIHNPYNQPHGTPWEILKEAFFNILGGKKCKHDLKKEKFNRGEVFFWTLKLVVHN